jgi:uncharacterized protein YuzE
MKLHYFPDTDTLAITLCEEAASETEDLTESVLVDYNAQRQVVAITIEHAAQQIDLGAVEVNGLPQVRVHTLTGASPLRMKLDYDPGADAAYITLRPGVPFAFTHHVDDDRNTDYGPDNQPIGVELLGVSHGLDVTDLPQRAALARLLAEAHLPGWEES